MNNLYKKVIAAKPAATGLLLLAFCLFANGLAAQTLPVPGFTLPDGKTIHITYKVTVNNPITACQISNQATLSGDNLATVTTDDPDIGGSNDPTITIVADATPPTALCKNASLQVEPNGEATLTAADVNNGSTDNCGVQQIEVSPTTFTCANIGANTVVLTVTDMSGLSSTCTATVTITDPNQYCCAAPDAFCKSATILLDGSGQGVITPADVDDGSIYTCGLSSMTVNPTTVNCSQIGTVTVTLTVTDVNNASASCTATVTVQDDMAPSVVCKNATVAVNASGLGAVASAQVFQSATDNCGTVNQVSVSPNTFTCSNLGPNTVTLTVNDGHGNTATCTATVTVQDNIAPSVVCKNATVAVNASGNAGITTAAVYQSGSDNCGTVNQVSVSPNAFTCSNFGPNTVTLTVNDGHGNTATCTATVTVQDNIAPSVVCKNATAPLNASGTASVTTSNVYQSGSDNCGTVNQVSVSPNTFTCSNLGPNTVTLTVNDGHGNTATCTATVTVTTGAFDSDNDGVANCIDNCKNTPNPTQVDSDCDGVGNACDVCPGGDDKVDNNNDGLPDCKYPPSFDQIIADWKCGNNLQKVQVCHNGNTLCLGYGSLSGHVGHGDYIGPCGGASCDNSSKVITNTPPQTTKATLFPNPATGEVWLDLSAFEGSAVVIRLVDLRGGIVQDFTLPKADQEPVLLNLAGQARGLYFVQVQPQGKAMQTLKLVVE